MNMKKALAGLALTGALSSVAGTAVAATQYPVEGGHWNYGFNGVGIYSDYFHGSRCHGSSVWNDWGNNRSIDVSPGQWSNSWLGATPWTNNKYYYRVC
ncbi:lactococcin 972 family bacteriocin [Arthrobacter sp. 2RAF6]|uniref:lactococcin 972 family bacteriocin n=1 Tax=Arthrobacter sp. 2RAF6 TaxID=3233002 RepID=UPI003F8E8BAF